MLDIEASGLGRGSHPIEVDLVLAERELALPCHRACAGARLLQATFRRLGPLHGR